MNISKWTIVVVIFMVVGFLSYIGIATHNTSVDNPKPPIDTVPYVITHYENDGGKSRYYVDDYDLSNSIIMFDDYYKIGISNIYFYYDTPVFINGNWKVEQRR